jgi:hypothetical protein
MKEKESKWKNVIKKINLDPYDQVCYMCVDCSKERMRKFFNDDETLTDGLFDGTKVAFSISGTNDPENPGNHNAFVIVVLSEGSKAKTISEAANDITHEIFHVVTDLMEGIGHTTKPDTAEPACYLAGHIAEELFKVVLSTYGKSDKLR